MNTQILLIDDDQSVLEVMRFQLADHGWAVSAFSDAKEALATFDPERHRLVITDMKMPQVDGLEVLRAIQQRSPATPVIMITAFGSVELAVKAMQQGAADYLTKPIGRQELKLRVEKTLARLRLEEENRQLQAQVKLSHNQTTIILRSPLMQALLEKVQRVASTPATVLILGESGTGKELIARALHQLSNRCKGQFVAVNCAAIPRDLLEAELFGVARGAYTGASHSRKGKFENANDGTLLLDEVGEMPLALQAKLLRVLEEQTVDIVGGKTISLNVRILASTNRDLSQAVREGSFRQDLYYRLNVIPLHVAPLRDRRQDVAPLIQHFAWKYGAGSAISVSDELVEHLERQPWPGNVRELENTIARLVLLREHDRLTLMDLEQGTVPTPRNADDLYGLRLPDDRLPFHALERALIVRALKMHVGNQSRTARYLEIPRHVLLYRLEKYSITSDEWRIG